MPVVDPTQLYYNLLRIAFDEDKSRPLGFRCQVCIRANRDLFDNEKAKDRLAKGEIILYVDGYSLTVKVGFGLEVPVC